MIDVNLLGPWRVTAAALPALRASRGRVVNVASGLAHLTVPFATAYCMSKRGLVAYSDALRIEHGDAITVTTVYPGYIRTGIHDAARERGLGLEGAVPAERLSDAADTLVRAALGRRRATSPPRAPGRSPTPSCGASRAGCRPRRARARCAGSRRRGTSTPPSWPATSGRG